MQNTFSGSRGRKNRGLIGTVLGLAVWQAEPAAASFDAAGIWTLSQDGTQRQCRMQFRNETVGTGQAVAMPPGCHRAFPILNGVRSWVRVDNAHLSLNNDADAAVLLFEDDGSGRLHAIGPEGGDSYELTALGARPSASPPSSPVVTDPTSAPTPSQQTVVIPKPPPVLPEATVATVAGHYAVMRGSRDTGCMVTLEEPARSATSTLKARLAPACRDQGIIVFDPVGWQLKAGRLVLLARKGHSTDLERDAAGTWVKDGKSAEPLGLKRL